MKQIYFAILAILFCGGLQSHADVQYPRIESMEGRYRGKDPLGKACSVRIDRVEDSFNVSVQSETQGNLFFRRAPIRDLQEKMVNDTQWQMREGGYHKGVITMSYFRTSGQASVFVGPNEALRAIWNEGQLSLIDITQQRGSGPFIAPNMQRSIMCFGLQAITI